MSIKMPFRQVFQIEDVNGTWIHPDFHFMRGSNIESYDIDELDEWGKNRSMEFMFVEKEPPVDDEYETVHGWFPRNPGEEWMLIYKTDSEDGIYGIFARHVGTTE